MTENEAVLAWRLAVADCEKMKTMLWNVPPMKLGISADRTPPFGRRECDLLELLWRHGEQTSCDLRRYSARRVATLFTPSALKLRLHASYVSPAAGHGAKALAIALLLQSHTASACGIDAGHHAIESLFRAAY